MNRTRSRIRRQLVGGGVWGLALLGLLLAGCETYFVDPNPPDLVLLAREYTVKMADTPMVYGLLFDLNLPDATECARIKNQLTQGLRAVLLPSGREGLELPAVDFAPGCAQQSNQRYLYSTYEAHANTVAKRYGEGRVRIVFFYFNNVSLPLVTQLQEDFRLLQTRGRNAPQVWALATPEVNASGRFAQSVPWSYSADSRLTAKFEEQLRAQLPFQQAEPVPAEGLALFTSQELTWARAFKGCGRPSNLSGVNFNYGPQTTSVEAGKPPRYLVSVLAQEPVSKSEKPAPVIFRFQLEVCRANCERFYPLPPNGELNAWAPTPTCFLTGTY